MYVVEIRKAAKIMRISTKMYYCYHEMPKRSENKMVKVNVDGRNQNVLWVFAK